MKGNGHNAVVASLKGRGILKAAEECGGLGDAIHRYLWTGLMRRLETGLSGLSLSLTIEVGLATKVGLALTGTRNDCCIGTPYSPGLAKLSRNIENGKTNKLFSI